VFVPYLGVWCDIVWCLMNAVCLWSAAGCAAVAIFNSLCLHPSAGVRVQAARLGPVRAM
jgi:hypothetical protein